jgi:hypothetical protein
MHGESFSSATSGIHPADAQESQLVKLVLHRYSERQTGTRRNAQKITGQFQCTKFKRFDIS